MIPPTTERPSGSHHGPKDPIRAHPVPAYFVLAYLLAWTYWVPLALAEHDWISLPWSTHLPGLTAPLGAAVIVTWTTDGLFGVRALGRRMFRWRVGAVWALASVSPLVVFAGVLALMALVGSGPTTEAMGRFDGIGDIGAPGLLLVLIVVNGLGEETGWRGYAHDRLNTGADPRRPVGIVAGLWAGWHLPLFFFHDGFQELPLYTLPGWLIGIGAGAVVLAWLYERSGRSILVVAIWHGTYNWAAASDAADGAIGAIVTAAVIVAALVLTRRGRFSRSDAADSGSTRPDRGGRTDVAGEPGPWPLDPDAFLSDADGDVDTERRQR